MVSVMGKRWNKPDYLIELLEAEDAPELIKFWRSPDRRGPGRTRSAPGRNGPASQEESDAPSSQDSVTGGAGGPAVSHV